MSEMQVSMKLTLDDLASGPLAKFAERLKGLESALAPLNEKLRALNKSTQSIGTNASKSATGFDGIVTALNRLGEGLRQLDTKISATSDSWLQFGMNAKEATTQTAGAADAIDLAAGKIDALGTKTRSTNSALKAMAEIWAGMKLEHGLRASVNQSSDFTTQLSQLRSLGLTQGQVNYARGESFRVSKQLPYVSAADALGAYRAVIAATGQNNEALIAGALPQLLRNAYTYKNQLSSHASLADIIGNFAGIAEARGLSQSPQGLIEASNQALQAALGTQGRIKLSQQEMVARQYKYGGAQLIDRAGYAQIMALAEQYTLAGHEGGGSGGSRGVSQVGTALGMVLKTILGGKMNKLTRALFDQMGMFTMDGTIGGTATTSLNTTAILRGSTEGERNPIKWIHDVLVPRMLAFAEKNAATYFPHGNIHNADAQKMALERLSVQMFGPTGGVNVANMVSMIANPSIYSRLTSSEHLQSGVRTGTQGVQLTNAYTRALSHFHAATTNLQIGFRGLLPILTPIINGFARFVDAIDRVLQKTPAFGAALGTIGSAVGALLAIRGFQALFGKINLLMWGAERAALVTQSAASEMAAAWASRLAIMGRAAMRFSAIAASAFALYAAGNSIKVWGVTINNIFRASLVEVMGVFDHFFTYIENGFDRLMAKIVAGMEWVNHLTHGMGQGFLKKTESSYLGAIQRRQQALGSRDVLRQQTFDWFMSKQAQPGYLRAPKSMPDAEKLAQIKQTLAASPLIHLMGGIPHLGGHAPHALRVQTHLKALADRMSLAYLGITNPMAAKIESVRQKYGAISNRLYAGGYMAQGSEALAVAHHAITRLRYQHAMGNLGLLQGHLHQQLTNNAALVTTGSLTKMEAAQRTIELQRQAAPAMIKAADAALTYARALGDPKLVRSLEEQRTKLEAMGKQLGYYGQQVQHTLQQSFNGLTNSILRGQKTWGQMLGTFFSQLGGGIEHQFAHNLSASIAKSKWGKSFSSGVGSLFTDVFGSNGPSKPGAGTSAGHSTLHQAAGWLSDIATLFSSFHSFAVGADRIPHDMVAQIHKGEMIIPAAGAEALRNGTATLGGGHQINLTVHAIDTQGMLQALHSVRHEAVAMLDNARQSS